MTKNNTEVANVLTPDELRSIVRDIAARAPVIPQAAVASDVQRRRLARLSQEMVEASVSALSSTVEVQAALGRSYDDVRDEDMASLEWMIALDAMRNCLGELSAANERRREHVGLTALQTYDICRSLAKHTKHVATLEPYVATMRRIMARIRGKKTRVSQTPAPEPAPQKVAA
jgi:hypothetical protein